MPADFFDHLDGTLRDATGWHWAERIKRRPRVHPQREHTDPFGDPRLRWLMPWAASVDRQLDFDGQWATCTYCEAPFERRGYRTLLLGDTDPEGHPTLVDVRQELPGRFRSAGAQVCADLSACLARGTFEPMTSTDG